MSGCPGKPEGDHSWTVFAQGIGCLFCSAWRPRPRATLHVDPHPTSLLSLR